MVANLELGYLDEELHGIICTRCVNCMGVCPCDYDSSSSNCRDGIWHEKIDFILYVASKLVKEL